MANPTWFDAKVYMANKLAQLKATEPTVDWTEEKLTKVMEENGFKGDEGAYAHFTQFGEAENVSPNELFDVKEYLAAKAKQLNSMNVDGKVWTEVSVMDAIKSAGMNSAWEHYVKFGSAEGINPSNDFNAEGYILAKTQLMNETSEGGRSNWTVAEVKAAFAENGLSALEHYNLFGQAEFKAENKETELAKAIEVTDKVGINDTFDPYTGAETYATLIDALAAQKEGSLAAKYTITAAADAGDVTVAQQAGLAALLAGATPAITTTPTYHLVDTVDALTAVSSTILMGSEGGYDISDTLANVAAGADGLVNKAIVATAKVAFGAKGVDPEVKDSKADVVTTTVKYDDIDDKSGITLVKADEDAKGKAEIVIDASATATGLKVDVDATNDAFSALDGVSYNFIGTAKADTLTVGKDFASINAGAGDDVLNLALAATWSGAVKLDGGAGNDTLHITSSDAAFNFSSEGVLNSIEAISVDSAMGKLLLNEETEGFKITVAKEASATIVGGQGKDVITLAAEHAATTIRFQNNTDPTDGANEKFHAEFYKDDSITGFKWGDTSGDVLKVSEVLGGKNGSAFLNATHAVASAGITAADKQVVTITDLAELKVDTFADSAVAGKIGVSVNTTFFVACDNVSDDTNDANMYFVTVGATTSDIKIELVGTVTVDAAWTGGDVANFA